MSKLFLTILWCLLYIRFGVFGFFLAFAISILYNLLIDGGSEINELYDNDDKNS